MTQKEQYMKAGFKLMPSGKPNSYLWQKHIGRVGSCKDSTWLSGKPRKGSQAEVGHHTCCGSKRSYYHKIGCKVVDAPEDLSDLKDL